MLACLLAVVFIFGRFLSLFHRISPSISEEELKEAFGVYDKDGNGQISASELKQVTFPRTYFQTLFRLQTIKIVFCLFNKRMSPLFRC